jgi:hypothetical protein
MLDISEFSQSFFDASSEAWKKNKVRYGQAMYKYKKNAFPHDTEMPSKKATTARNEKELRKRQTTDELAPPHERRSPRLREQHLRETYSKV